MQRSVVRKIRKAHVLRWIALLTSVLCAGCQRARPPGTKPPGATPERVVSLAPSMTEILIDLGLAGRLVGTSDYCPDLPPDPATGRTVARVGGLNNPNLEVVLTLNPDLVMSVQNPADRTMTALEARGIAVYARDPQALEQVFATIEEVGDRFDVGARARSLVGDLRARLAALQARTALWASHPTVYVEVDYPPPWTVGRGSFVYEAVVAAGGQPLFPEDFPGQKGSYPTVSVEAVITRDPDVVLPLHPLDRPIAERKGFAELKAVRNGRVLTDFDRDSLLHSSPRLVHGIEELSLRLAPR